MNPLTWGLLLLAVGGANMYWAQVVGDRAPHQRALIVLHVAAAIGCGLAGGFEVIRYLTGHG